MKIKPWIEAMRLRTLPVSVAGVFAASGYALLNGSFNGIVAALCLSFAVLAQIASNFANEYYDFKSGLDRPGREGPRRGVTEGDISPSAMKTATFVTLALACAVGCSLIYWGGWWLIAAGAAIALGVLAYSTGPYPLSHHALGEVAVICFFGIAPVCLTYYIMSGSIDSLSVIFGAVAIGLMGANVLIVNNYRDIADDSAVGKRTLAVRIGRRATATLYLISGYLAASLVAPVWYAIALTAPAWWIAPAAYILLHTALWLKITSRSGAALNPMLGATAMLMLAYSIAFVIACI